jgi:hypothetical protein
LSLEATTFAVIPFEYGVLEPGRDSLACAKCPRRAGIRGGGRTPRMSQRPELSSFSLAPNPASTPASAPGPAPKPRQAPQRIPPWLERAELFLRVLLRMYIGLAICYVPWSRMFWDQNPLFVEFPTLGIYAASGMVRGLVSGLGLLNLWIAFHDAFRHWDG